MRAIIAAGGTAGHINPGLAIADKIKEVFPESEILFVGTPDGMEAELVQKAGYPFASFKMAGMQRKLSLKNIVRNAKAACYLVAAGRYAGRILREFKPDIVVGTGGYVSVPIVRAAALRDIKTATHESNSLPGLATKLLAKHVDKLFIADAAAKRHIPQKEKCIVTGNPMRVSIPIMEKEKARKKLGLPEGFTIASIGGSNGSNRISEAVAALLAWEVEVGKINHIHAYGRNGKDVFGEYLEKYKVKLTPERMKMQEYIHDMYTCYSAADLIISRSGSMTQTELKAIGRASVQIPWSGAAENHQYYNALSMEKQGAAILIKDEELTPELLTRKVRELFQSPERISEMETRAGEMGIPDAAGNIVSEITGLVYSKIK